MRSFPGFLRGARLVLPLLAVVACNNAPPPEPPPPGAIEKSGPVVMTVNGDTVTQDMVDAVTRRIPDDQMAQIKANDQQYKDLLTKMAIGQVLYKQALDKGLDKDPDVQKTIAMANREILASELLEQVAKSAVTDEKVQQYYDDHKVQFAKPSVHMMHMIVKAEDKKTADDIVAQLKGGADFAALAKQYSIDGGANGGDLGWVEKGRLIPELETPAFAANTGDVVGPIVTQHGLHIVKIAEKRDSTPLAEVRSQIEDKIKQDAVDDYIQKTKDEAKIEWVDTSKPQVDVTPMPAGAQPAGVAPAPGGDAAPMQGGPTGPATTPDGGQK